MKANASNPTNNTHKAVPRLRPQRHGTSRPCDDTCNRPTPSQAHCAAAGCHQTFGGVHGFDKHRREGTCLNPADLGMSSIKGIWRVPMSDEVRARFIALK